MDDQPQWWERLILCIGIILICLGAWAILITGIAVVIGLFG